MSWDFLRRIDLTWHTVKYLKFSQIVARCRLMVLKKLPLFMMVQKSFMAPVAIVPISTPFSLPAHRSYEGGWVFCFLNQRIDTRGAWAPEGSTRLWQFYLHYFGYLSEISNRDTIKWLLSDWIDHVPMSMLEAWHPYPISLRICNWVWAVSSWLDQDSDSSFRDKVLMSLQQQLHYLNSHLEFDVTGNHLLENCKALIIGGLCLNQPVYWEKGWGILQRELKEQLLSDGGHYERSPMYHVIVIEDLMVLAEAFRCVGHVAHFELLLPYIYKGCDFLKAVSFHNQLPLFNDSAHHVARDVDAILDVAKGTFGWKETQSADGTYFLPDSGFYISKTATNYFCMDTGALGPDFLLGHAHNDMLSFELIWDSEPLILDSGVFDYESGRPLKWRPIFRSTKAHNTVMVNGIEQNEVWGSFRVARRGYPDRVHVLKYGVEAWHTCYERYGVKIGRKVDVRFDLGRIEVTECVSCKQNCTLEGFLHFSPGIFLERETQMVYRIVTSKSVYYLEFFSTKVEVFFDESWYSPEFNVKMLRPVLVYNMTLDAGEHQVCFSIRKDRV